MDWYRARQQFNADLPDGAQRTVGLGEVLPADHLLVKRDLDAAAAAAKAGTERLPLFERLDSGEEAPPPKRGRAAAKGGA